MISTPLENVKEERPKCLDFDSLVSKQRGWSTKKIRPLRDRKKQKRGGSIDGRNNSELSWWRAFFPSRGPQEVLLISKRHFFLLFLQNHNLGEDHSLFSVTNDTWKRSVPKSKKKRNDFPKLLTFQSRNHFRRLQFDIRATLHAVLAFKPFQKLQNRDALPVSISPYLQHNKEKSK